MESQKISWLDFRRRGVWIVAFFIISVAIMWIGSQVPVGSTDAQSTYNELENEVKYTATLPGIFGNNFFQCLILFTPFIGPLYGVLVFFNTGFVIAVIAAVRSANPTMLFVTLFLFPHTWLEFFAYSLALSQSAFLAIAIIKGRFRQEAVRTCVIITICALVLLLAAVAEVILISLRG
jgi:uncharacterized membrane protein SpoIIM required for sporulation